MTNGITGGMPSSSPRAGWVNSASGLLYAVAKPQAVPASSAIPVPAAARTTVVASSLCSSPRAVMPISARIVSAGDGTSTSGCDHDTRNHTPTSVAVPASAT